jgi:Tfp pilus assembly protein PilO
VNKLSKAQRDQLIGIAFGTVALMAALWYFGVTAMQSDLAATQRKSTEMRQKLHDAEALMRRGDEISATLHSRSELLAKREAGLAPDRDSYAWLINTVNAFIQSRKGVNIDTYSQPEISDVGIIPRFPYRWATFRLKGTGYYHDFGKFFADFENAFPYFRIQNLNISANSGTGMEAEKLSVTFDLVAPVASSGPDIK